jgi:citrate synthase
MRDYLRQYLGVSALWGPLHGGADQAVLEMLEEIHKGGDTEAYMAKSQR